MYEPVKDGYQLIKSCDKPDNFPEDILAALPLKENDFKVTCVLGKKAIQGLEGMVFILHEFVHCYQYNTIELELKNKLKINRYYMEKKEYDWELSHPFPYDDEAIKNLYFDFIESASSGRYHRVPILRRRLKEILREMDYEYMVWEEWKEGFARYIENLIREKVGLKINSYTSGIAFNRLAFYAGGEALIKYLINIDPSLEIDLSRLFERMFNIEI